MARIQLKIWRAPLATLQANLAEGEVGIASESNTFYKRPDGSPTGALIPIGGGQGVATMRAKVATTGNIALTGLQTIDGIALAAGDFVLVGSQTNPAQNGVYVAAAGAWVRAAGADAWTNLINAIYVVEQGATLADTIWMCTSDTGGTLGTTAVAFQAVNNKTGAVLASVTPSADALPYFTGTGTAATTTLTAAARTLLDDATTAAMLTTLGAQPVDANLTALAAMATTGMLVRTGNGTAASRQLAVSGTGLSVTNGDGVAAQAARLWAGAAVPPLLSSFSAVALAAARQAAPALPRALLLDHWCADTVAGAQALDCRALVGEVRLWNAARAAAARRAAACAKAAGGSPAATARCCRSAGSRTRPGTRRSAASDRPRASSHR